MIDEIVDPERLVDTLLGHKRANVSRKIAEMDSEYRVELVYESLKEFEKQQMETTLSPFTSLACKVMMLQLYINAPVIIKEEVEKVHGGEYDQEDS
jgi:hypothetical protein